MKEPTFNEWWLSLSDEQQVAWMEDKWILADISFRKGIEIGKSLAMANNQFDLTQAKPSQVN